MLVVIRELPHALAVGTKKSVGLRMTCNENCDHPLVGWLYDSHPVAFRSEGLPLSFKALPGRWLHASYQLLILERGRHVFENLGLRLCSPFGLWLVAETIPIINEVRVYPDFMSIMHYTLLATDNRHGKRRTTCWPLNILANV